jgi:GT2 family glycosyltransferase
LKNLLYRFVSAIPLGWRNWISSISIVKLCYDAIMGGHSPKVYYKQLLTQQEKLLALNSKSFNASYSKQPITVVIELSPGFERRLAACIDSLLLLTNDIDSLCFLYDGASDENNKQHLINNVLAPLLVNASFGYTVDSKAHFINNRLDEPVSVISGAFVWCQVPVIFYAYTFKMLLHCYYSSTNNSSTNNSSADKCPAVIYCDHDMLSNGIRTSPSLKPALNIDWLLGSNYMGKVILFNKTQLANHVRNLGLSANDHDVDSLHLLLKEIASDSTCLIKHVPFVLYSEQHIDQEVLVVNESYPVVTRLSWPLPEKLPLVSIIIPTRNGKQLVAQCIESLYKFTHYNNFEVLLVDNGSDDVQSIDYFKQLVGANKVKLLHYNAPFNFSAINNFAVAHAKGDVLLFMNNDIELLHEHWLTEMVMQAMRDDIGCVGAKLYYSDMTIQHAGVIVGLWGCAGHGHKHFERADSGYMNRLNVVQNYSAVTAACMAVRTTVFNEVKGFNEKDLSVSFNDVDFCLKVQATGYRNLWTPYAEMIHHESISRGPENTPEKKTREAKEIAYMRKTWHLETTVDPAYNPWLTHQKEDFSFVAEKR